MCLRWLSQRPSSEAHSDHSLLGVRATMPSRQRGILTSRPEPTTALATAPWRHFLSCGAKCPAWEAETTEACLLSSGGPTSRCGLGRCPRLSPSFWNWLAALGIPCLIDTSAQSLPPPSHGQVFCVSSLDLCALNLALFFPIRTLVSEFTSQDNLFLRCLI